MLDDKTAKTKIQELVNEYYEYKTKSFSEGAIETKLILPLFEALGWDIRHDTIPKESVQRKEGRGIPDFTFQLNGVTVFYLEAKKLSVKLTENEAKQAISYSLSRRVPFAVLTNFEELKIFCAEENEAFKKPFKHFKCEEFIDRFNELKLLSRPSFEENKLMELASREGRLKERRKIDEILLDDLMLIRKKLAHNLEKKYPDKYSIQERDDIVQRIIDRLIFIRSCEDRQNNIEGIELKELLVFSDVRIYSKLKEVFVEYDKVFNSGLFKPNYDNDCDNIALDGQVIKELISHLYESKDHQYIYNFDWIDADVLGQVYEQYLGQILAETKSGRTKLKGGLPHKKEQGIYYTPTSVVEYIVKNTLGAILKNKRTEELKKVKVLDPTCGSGSFLIKSFDELKKAYGEKGGQQRLNLGSAILTENLFGVDLDEKAVEIASLNLLLKATETKHRLPELGNNLKCGNSFIDDEKIAGLKAFNWGQKFANVFAEGKFDVIVGNPPYVHQKGGKNAPKIAYLERDYYRNNYKSVYLENVKSRGGIKLNLFVPYAERAINLLKPNGILGFIVHKNLLKVESYKLLRKFILENCVIEQIVDLGAGVFPEVTGETIIIILRKESSTTKRNKHEIKIRHHLIKTSDLLDGKGTETKIAQEKFLQSVDNMFSIYVNDKIESLKKNLWRDAKKLDAVVKIVSFGLSTIDNKKYVVETKLNDNYKPVVMGRDIGKWIVKNHNKFVLYEPKILNRTGDVEAFNYPEKLIFQRIGVGLIGAYDNEKFYCFNSTNMILPKETLNEKRLSLKYILGLLNSRLLNFYYNAVFSTESHLTVNVTQGYLSQMPIKVVTSNEQQTIISFVDKLIDLNKRLNELGDKKTHETATLEENIKKLNSELDEKVFDLYGLDDDEKKLVRESVK